MKVSEILRKLKDDGWYLHATRGSHRQFKHQTSPRVSQFQASQAMIWRQEL
jgi:predicted RNA binding protein YcfA (HicA-like mRNA interferase family)